MAKKPVFKSGKPLFVRNESGILVPAFAEDPCDCCDECCSAESVTAIFDGLDGLMKNANGSYQLPKVSETAQNCRYSALFENVSGYPECMGCGCPNRWCGLVVNANWQKDPETWGGAANLIAPDIPGETTGAAYGFDNNINCLGSNTSSSASISIPASVLFECGENPCTVTFNQQDLGLAAAGTMTIIR